MTLNKGGFSLKSRLTFISIDLSFIMIFESFMLRETITDDDNRYSYEY